MDTLVVISVFVAYCIVGISGHGRMMEPPQRSSIWRFNSSFPKNYNDNELFCGGVGIQWGQNDGKCGTCGDPYDGVRENEAGGKYALGHIVKTYQTGQSIEIGIELTAAHLGFFEFRLCPHNNINVPIQQDCLDENVLEISNSGGKTKYEPGSKVGWHEIYVDLPQGMTCSQCVLQWYYKSGNSWNCEADGYCCMGCGAQETFINCADIAVSGDGGPITTTPGATTSAPTTPDTDITCDPETLAPTDQTDEPTPEPETEPPATTPGPTPEPETEPPATTAAPTPEPETEAPATTAAPTNPPSPTSDVAATTAAPLDIVCPDGSVVSCDGETEFVVDYCNTHCGQGSPACTADMCTCTCKKYSCKAIGAHAATPGMDEWCEGECVQGCPSLSGQCECEYD